MREVLEEVPRVRKDAGYPPLVTPTSQIVGTQAVFNVLMGRYKVVTAEFADLVLGYYGETAAAKDPEIVKQAAETTKKSVIHGRPADTLKPEWDELRAVALALPGCNGSDEDVLTNAMFPQVAPKFFSTRKDGPKNLSKPIKSDAKPPATPQAPSPNAARPGPAPAGGHNGTMNYVVTLNGNAHNVTVTPAD